MAVQLLDLPQLCLEEIFKDLSYSEISRLGAVCRYFREIAKTIFRLYFRRQEEVIEREMEKIEIEASKLDKLTVDEHLYLALLHSVLRILLSEAKMLKAHCWRYMRDPSYDFCFPAGRILDEFEQILRSVRQKTLSKDIEPEISTTLFHLGEKFYDYFDNKIETSFRESSGMHVKLFSESNRQTFLPNIYNFVSNATKENLLRGIHKHMKRNRLNDIQGSINKSISKLCVICETFGHTFSAVYQRENGESNFRNAYILVLSLLFPEAKEKTLFGVKLMDILDCCSTSDFHSLLYYDSDVEGFQINTEYKLTDVNVLQALPSIGLPCSTVQRQLNKICRYIRNNVRWTNLFHPLQDLWTLEDAIEINRSVHTASALLRQWKLQRSSSRMTLDNADNDVPQYNYQRVVSRFKNCFGLVVMANLECPKTDDMPLKLQNHIYINKKRSPENVNATEDKMNKRFSNHWGENIIMYKFHLELKIQYPSFLTDKIQEAILIVEQLGDETTITSNDDEVRKSATFRVDEISYDD